MAELTEQNVGEEKRRRRSRKGETRRAEILAAAMRRFAEDGYQNAAIGDIARDVGLSLPGLLHHFPTKVDLLLAILAKRDLDSADFIGHYRADLSGLLEGMVEIFRRNAGMTEVIRAFAILNAESLMKDHPAKAWFLDRATEMQQHIAATFERAAAEGAIDAGIDAKAMAAELIAVMDGLQMLWLRDPDRFDMVGGLEAYVIRLLASLGLKE
ncbi:TetR/AcrR family transcriptional regulator [Rhizobium binae]|nr:TetR/AcrR family transcriptional regulator [Rhizobium binae]NKL50936.1 TetR family transcriptional regulator [Rhizobium leguminosarum bv. viciae]MBX4949713.1 TetR/AcrR family transcriptional regulator [Rhizobium binae]MBX4966813.1 TetR/AcrR family transcriptional regulator [Rhizobium binae]MBX4994393.1 TetR/AcrR family transcriptional regulator [Rhizobium binae]QSY84970.1 TetR/AcrR family transcriptional regulator [Rhizobium binae]